MGGGSSRVESLRRAERRRWEWLLVPLAALSRVRAVALAPTGKTGAQGEQWSGGSAVGGGWSQWEAKCRSRKPLGSRCGGAVAAIPYEVLVKILIGMLDRAVCDGAICASHSDRRGLLLLMLWCCSVGSSSSAGALSCQCGGGLSCRGFVVCGKRVRESSRVENRRKSPEHEKEPGQLRRRPAWGVIRGHRTRQGVLHLPTANCQCERDSSPARPAQGLRIACCTSLHKLRLLAQAPRSHLPVTYTVPRSGTLDTTRAGRGPTGFHLQSWSALGQPGLWSVGLRWIGLSSRSRTKHAHAPR